MTGGEIEDFAEHLIGFAETEPLRERLRTVLHALPSDVRRNLLDDPRFQITLENYVPGKGWSLWMPSPGLPGSNSRCVVLRPRLATCPAEFAHYVIAHELAHAYLNNGGWGDITDAEQAADAMAASWGFHRPPGGRPW